VLRNAFVSAFARSLEGSISVKNVRENLQGIGEPAADSKGKDKDKKKAKEQDGEKKRQKDGDEKKEPAFGPKR
jgi:hypothetical protein